MGRCRLVSWTDVAIAQVVKQRVEGVLTVDQRILQGSQEMLERLIQTTQNGKGVINTAFIERLNATFHLCLNNLVRRTRTLARRTETFTAGMYITIGFSPAGEKGAAQAANFGKKVALMERAAHVGGAGVNTGTVPCKTLRETALYFSGLRQRGLYGIDYSLKENLNIHSFMFREQAVVEAEWNTISDNLARHHIDTFWGNASFKDAHTLHVELADGSARDLTTNVVLIASGSAPFHPPEEPFDHNGSNDSDSILKLDRIPKSMAIVGGRVIGSEYAGIFDLPYKERLSPVIPLAVYTISKSPWPA